jgi:hypothetical protein
MCTPDFLVAHLNIIHDKPLFNQLLADYKLFILQREFISLSIMTPVDYQKRRYVAFLWSLYPGLTDAGNQDKMSMKGYRENWQNTI